MKIMGAIDGYSTIVMNSDGKMYIRIDIPNVGNPFVPWYEGDAMMMHLNALPDDVADACEATYQALRAKESQK